jgi:hypothetical protein
MAGEDAPARYREGAGDDHDRAFSEAVADPAAVQAAWDNWNYEVAFAERFVDQATTSALQGPTLAAAAIMGRCFCGRYWST